MNLALPGKGSQRVIKNGANTKDAVEAILAVIDQCSAEPFTQALAHDFLKVSKSKQDLLQNILTFAFKSTYYEANPQDHQKIRTVSRTLKDGRANCVDYTVLMCSILKAAGIPCTFKIVNYMPGQPFVHIFPCVDNQCLDIVPQQEQRLGIEAITREPGSIPVLGQTMPFSQHLEFNVN